VSFTGAILNLSDNADQPSARQSSTGRTESDIDSSPDSTTDEIVGEEAVSIEGYSCAEDLTPVESPCIIEAVPEAEPTHPVDDVAEEDWGIWGAFTSSAKKKRGKKKEKGRHVFEYFEYEAPAEETPAEEAPAEEAPAEEAPAEVAPAEEAPAEEAPAEEAPAEEALAEEALAEEAPAEEAPAEEAAAEEAYAEEAYAEEAPAEEAPAEEAYAEEAPAEEAPAEEAYAEEAPAEETYAEEAPAEEAPAEEAPAEEAPAEEAPAEEAPAEEAPVADYYASPRAYRYRAFAQETTPDNTPCRRRGYHLADDARWMECPKCRAELSTIARIMTASTPGWRNFS
jgi:hypothetical protein